MGDAAKVAPLTTTGAIGCHKCGLIVGLAGNPPPRPVMQ
jgi:hypothetical protein